VRSPADGWRRRSWIAAPALAAIWQVRREWDATPRARLDFHIYYDAVQAMHRSSIYDFKDRIFPLGFTYPPFAAVLLRPLVAMHESLAEHTWLVLSAALTVAFALVSVRMTAVVTGVERAVASSVVVLAMPTTLTLRLGQINALIACLLAVDAWLMQRRNRVGGAATGIATAIKVTPAALLVALVVARRAREAARAVAVAATATVLAAVVRPDDTWRYFTDVVFDTGRVGRGGRFNDSLRRLVDSGVADRTLLYVLALTLVLAATVVGVRAAARRDDVFGVVTITMVCSYLISPITWGHHLYFVAPAAILLWRRGTLPTRALALAGAVLVLDPFEGGQGATWAAWRIAFMAVALVVLAATPSDERAATRPPVEARPVSAPAGG
jgi:alpha-1,2-mannosyltransferase